MVLHGAFDAHGLVDSMLQRALTALNEATALRVRPGRRREVANEIFARAGAVDEVSNCSDGLPGMDCRLDAADGGPMRTMSLPSWTCGRNVRNA